MEILKPLLNDRFVIMFMLRVMLNKRYFHITGKYRGFLDIEIVISTSNHKIPIKFHNLEN